MSEPDKKYLEEMNIPVNYETEEFLLCSWLMEKSNQIEFLLEIVTTVEQKQPLEMVQILPEFAMVLFRKKAK